MGRKLTILPLVGILRRRQRREKVSVGERKLERNGETFFCDFEGKKMEVKIFWKPLKLQSREAKSEKEQLFLRE